MTDSPRDDNLSEFQSPEDYDCEYGSYEPEGPFYESLADRLGGPVLDLACGTGRISIPLARKGHRVTGIDLAQPMLDHARRKAGTLPARWELGDCRDFALGTEFAFAIMTGNAFQAYLTDADQKALLACIHRHLKPGGRFAFETRNPRPDDLQSNEEEVYWHSYTDTAGRKIDVSYTERYDAATRILDNRMFRRVSGSKDAPRASRIRIRYTDRHRLSALLDAAGFVVEEQFGDFDRSAPGDEAPSIVTIARRSD